MQIEDLSKWKETVIKGDSLEISFVLSFFVLKKRRKLLKGGYEFFQSPEEIYLHNLNLIFNKSNPS